MMNEPAYMDVELRLDGVPWLPWRPATCLGLGSVELVDGRERERIATVSFAWGPVVESGCAYSLLEYHDVDSSDWLLELERPRVSREFSNADVELRLVGSVLRHFSQGRRCQTTMIIEPDNWQSRKIDDRNGRKSVLKKYWSRIGFDCLVVGTGIVDEERAVQEIADFEAPSPLDSWGPYTRGLPGFE